MGATAYRRTERFSPQLYHVRPALVNPPDTAFARCRDSAEVLYGQPRRENILSAIMRPPSPLS